MRTHSSAGKPSLAKGHSSGSSIKVETSQLWIPSSFTENLRGWILTSSYHFASNSYWSSPVTISNSSVPTLSTSPLEGEDWSKWYVFPLSKVYPSEHKGLCTRLSITNLDSGYLTETLKVVTPTILGRVGPTILNGILSPPSVKSLLRIKQSSLISVIIVPSGRMSVWAVTSIPIKSDGSNPSTRGAKLKPQTLLFTAFSSSSKVTFPVKSSTGGSTSTGPKIASTTAPLPPPHSSATWTKGGSV